MKKVFVFSLFLVFSLACLSSASLQHGGGGESSAVEVAPVVEFLDQSAAVETLHLNESLDERCAVVVADALNLRAAPSANDIVLTWLDRGDLVEVIGKTDPDWWRVRFEGVEGFARSIYLRDLECGK